MKATYGNIRTTADLRREIVGINTKVPLLDGSSRRYIFLDNAASTPTFRSVLRTIEEFMPWYSGVNRGLGFKAVVSTEVYNQTHRAAGEFVGADLSQNVVLFGKNTTECVNQLSRHFHFLENDIVLTTLMEHHSNDLPWRKYAKVIHSGILDDGSVDLAALRQQLKIHAGKIKLVAISGASNVTGICNPVHEVAEWAHEIGAKIFVDAAQLVAHRPVNILPNDHPQHIDFIAYSAHKLYAPFGIGVLIGPSEFFAGDTPDFVGGGTVSYVGIDEVEWTGLPHREEAGSPNVVGAVALSESIAMLRSVGMQAIADHEHHLLEYAIPKMEKLPGVLIYGPVRNVKNKVGVIPFNIEDMDHSLVATILSTEGGVGVRNGNFCAQVYMRALLHVSQEDEKMKRASRCDSPILPGMVRASFGCYNNEEDVDIFLDMLDRVCRKEYRGRYSIDPLSGMYVAEGFNIQPAEYFQRLRKLEEGTLIAEAGTL